MKTTTMKNNFSKVIKTTKHSYAIAQPDKNNVFERTTYRTGDGDIPRPIRPGGEDHLKYKSADFAKDDDARTPV